MSSWTAICPLDRLPVERGVAALVQGQQVALFRTSDDEVYAVDNLDPFSGAMVLARGIVGTRGGRWVVASPMYKQAFDLATGECLDDTSVRIRTYDMRLVGGILEVAAAADDANMKGS